VPEQRPSFSVLVDVFQTATPLEWIFQEGECFENMSPWQRELHSVKKMHKVKAALEKIDKRKSKKKI
jgi:hypothetical protein